jgi:hypothetical protein
MRLIRFHLKKERGSSDMVQENSSVIGIWNLISVITEADDGTISYPYGKDVGGLLMIDASGYFSVHLMNMKRPYFKIPDPRAGTSEEIKTAFENYIGYYGTFDLDETNRKLNFHVKGAWLPNWTGDQIRYYGFEGNRMNITSAPLLFDGKNRVGKLVFERVK